MNEPVPVSSFPKFLDDDSAHYLLLMTKNELDLKELQVRLDRLKEALHGSKSNSVAQKSNVELILSVRTRMSELSKNVKGVPVGSKEAQNSTVIIDALPAQNQLHSELNWVRKSLNRIQYEMESSTKEEYTRVVKEFNKNNSEVCFDHISQCLF